MPQLMTINEASAAMREALRETVKKHSSLFLLQAALMILAGIMAFAYPLLSSAALAVFLGWMLIFFGVSQIISLIGASQIPHFWLQLISAALAMLTGFLFVRNPGVAVGTMSLLMIVFFMVEGVSKIVFSLTVRPFPNWGWLLASGLLGVLIAVYLLSNPSLSIVVLGLLIGVQLVSEGAALGWMAWHAKRS